MISVEEFRDRARAVLPAGVFDYFDGAAGREHTAHDNEAAFRAWWFRRTVLTDVTDPRTATEVLGRTIAAPLLLAPTALQRMAHEKGEAATAAAARGAGLPFVVSTLSSVHVADVTAVGGDVWFQLYLHRDRGVTEELVRRAEEAGVRALVLTVDTPVPGRRLRDARRAFRPPAHVSAVHLAAPGMLPGDEQEPRPASLSDRFARQFDPGLTWHDVGRLVGLTSLPIVLKGIAQASDARRAVEHGARAVIVSNHGGRQLDGDRPTLHCLPEVAEAVEATGSGVEVYMDGGIRTGGDILKALALGARAVLIGRPYLWGLAADGEAGVSRVLRLLLDELTTDMRLTGLADTADASPDLLVQATPAPLPPTRHRTTQEYR